MSAGSASGGGGGHPAGPDVEELRRLRHDIRSPLTVITGFGRLIATRDDLTDEQRRDYAARIERAAEEIRRMLDERIG